MNGFYNEHGLGGLKNRRATRASCLPPPPSGTLSFAPDRIADISGHQISSLLENLLEGYYFIIFRSFPGAMETIPFSIIHTPTLFQLDMKIIN